jgi:serine/threonine protein kinase
VRGEEPSPASDLYAMGVLLYELLTGRVPFAGTSDYALMERILRDKPTAPIRVVPNLPKGLSEVLSRTLAKTPADRYADAPALSRALGAVVPTLYVDFGGLTSQPATVEVSTTGRPMPPPTREGGGPPPSRRVPRWLGVPFQREYRILTASILLAAVLLLGGVWLAPTGTGAR